MKGYGWKEMSSVSVLKMGRQTPSVQVKAVFTLELELRNSEPCKIPLKISCDAFTTFRASRIIYTRNDTLSNEESTFLITKCEPAF